MARLWSTGFEEQSLTAGVEFNANTDTSSAVSAISTTTVHGGAASLHVTGGTAGAAHVDYYYVTPNTGGSNNQFHRFYVYFSNFGSGGSGGAQIYGTLDSYNIEETFYISLTSGGVLNLRDGVTNTTIGSTSALSLSQWYRVEIAYLYDAATPTVTSYLDGTQFATGTLANNLNKNPSKLLIGLDDPSTNADFYMDDVAINDGTGSYQNGLPGVGQIIHLRPNATGDLAQWTKAGSSPAATNWQGLSEITPDDGVTLNEDKTLNNADMLNVDASGIASNSSVNVVAVGVRFANDTADTTAAFKLQVEKAASGTILQSAAIVPNSTTFRTNAPGSSTSTIRNYPITTYLDPDNSAWTQTTIDSMQVGYKTTVAHTNYNQVSSVWALIDYSPPITLYTLAVSDSSAVTENVNVTLPMAGVIVISVSDHSTISENISTPQVSYGVDREAANYQDGIGVVIV